MDNKRLSLSIDMDVPTAMLGAIVGDVVGSSYEHNNIKYCLSQDKLISDSSRFTDDTVMTCAVANGIMNGLVQLPHQWLTSEKNVDVLRCEIIKSMKSLGRKYLTSGYGFNFMKWLLSSKEKPYNSFGNGSAMRVSFAGWIANSLVEAEKLAEISAIVTHNHPEGIKGAVVIAGSIYILRQTQRKEDVRKYAAKFYDINFSLDDIRDEYSFDVSCQGSVPQSIVAFLEGNSFSDVIAKAISIVGDSDTIAAIAGSLAEVIYCIPQELRKDVLTRVDDELIGIVTNSIEFLRNYQSN